MNNITNFIIIIILCYCPNTILSMNNEPCLPPKKSNSCVCSGYRSYCQLQTGYTILDFPNSGSFVLQNIDYTTREFHLIDLDRCLPRKLMNLNLSSTPFQYRTQYNKYYKLYKCLHGVVHNNVTTTSTTMSGDVHVIDCLSNGNTYSVVATPWDYFMANCDEFLGGGEVVLPLDYQNGVETSTLVLTWLDGSKCVPQFACGDVGHSQSKRLIIIVGIAIGLGLPTVICIAYCVTKILTIRRAGATSTSAIRLSTIAPVQPNNNTGSPAQTQQQQPTLINTSGLDQPTLDSYPIVVIGESGRFLKSPNQETVCSICLSDYHINDTLKILPECLHRFHSECIDEWLRAKALCPICRATPPRTMF